MDRNEAVRLLKGGEEGVREWNSLRASDRRRIDLTKADLHGANLIGANLFAVILDGAVLSGAHLVGAELSQSLMRGVDLVGAALVGVRLHQTSLIRADLSYAVLRNADCLGAVLAQANLTGAQIEGCDLHGAICGATIFGDVDLSGAFGLDSIRHRGGSIIGIDTVLRSRGRIPEAFLRGCGVPAAWIDYLPSLLGSMEPIQFYSCFISYSARNQDFAERLHVDLQGKGVRCWYAPEDLKIGEKIRVGIDESIRIHDKLLLVLSKHAVASDWVEKEVETAMERERQQKRVVLFPIRLDDAVMKIETGWPADVRRSRNIGDFKKWKTHDAYQKAFERLLRDLRAEESTGAKPD